MNNDKLGFPSQIEEDKILRLVNKSKENFLFENIIKQYGSDKLQELPM